VKWASILDVPLRIAAADRSLGDMVDTILGAVTATTGFGAGTATSPANAFHNCRTREGAANEPARVVLVRLFRDACAERRSTPGPVGMSWKSPSRSTTSTSTSSARPDCDRPRDTTSLVCDAGLKPHRACGPRGAEALARPGKPGLPA
jgi:hypothetical protein